MTISRGQLSNAWAAGWLVLFLAVYFSQPLPNNGGIIRWDLWRVLPFSVLDALDPPVEPGSPPRGWGYLGQRLPLMLTAAVIAFAAWGAGVVVLAALRTNITRGERFYFECLLGLGVVSLLTLACGLAGALHRGLFFGVFFSCGVTGLISTRRRQRGATGGSSGPPVAASSRERHTGGTKPSPVAPAVETSLKLPSWLFIAIAPFLVGMLLGSLSPSTDFDVNEYHLGGPKEWFLAGRIEFLEHDIYTSFPFLTEMLLLAGMVLHGDWFAGALAGQLVLMLFAPLTAWGIFCLGRRWYSPLAGQLGALIYLTTPWVFRMSIIAYAEGGLAAYTAGAIVAGLLALERRRPDVALALLTGLCAGGAMACKYTGLVMAVAPWAVGLTLASGVRQSWRSAATILFAFSLGVAAFVGPWLLKNLVETGNPVYPLGYSVFGGRDLDDALADKWRRGHARPSAGSVTGEARDLVVKAFDVATVNDWTSPLVFAFAPLAWLWREDRRQIAMLWGLTAWLFLCWWLFTHHLDRFWLPLLPSACALAGLGAAAIVCHGRVGRSLAATITESSTWPCRTSIDTATSQSVRDRGTRVLAIAALAVGWVYNLGFVSTGLVGYNAGLTDLQSAADLAARITGPEIAWLNAAIAKRELPPETKVLCVGEAELFHARFPYVYNTVFDRSIFEKWCGEPGDTPSKDRPLRPAADIRQTFAAQGITHVLVNWAEIVRYRQSYGYTDFAHPSRFAELQKLGILGEPLWLPDKLGVRDFENLSPGERQFIEAWAPELIVPCDDGRCVLTGQVYPVLR